MNHQCQEQHQSTQSHASAEKQHELDSEFRAAYAEELVEQKALDRANEQVAWAASALVDGDPGDALSAASAAAQARQEAAQELAAAADRISKLMADNDIIERPHLTSLAHLCSVREFCGAMV
jgi:hypothetical protein